MNRAARKDALQQCLVGLCPDISYNLWVPIIAKVKTDKGDLVPYQYVEVGWCLGQKPAVEILQDFLIANQVQSFSLEIKLFQGCNYN